MATMWVTQLIIVGMEISNYKFNTFVTFALNPTSIKNFNSFNCFDIVKFNFSFPLYIHFHKCFLILIVNHYLPCHGGNVGDCDFNTFAFIYALLVKIDAKL